MPASKDNESETSIYQQFMKTEIYSRVVRINKAINTVPQPSSNSRFGWIQSNFYSLNTTFWEREKKGQKGMEVDSIIMISLLIIKHSPPIFLLFSSAESLISCQRMSGFHWRIVYICHVYRAKSNHSSLVEKKHHFCTLMLDNLLY